jgi:hypothetical protein
MKKLLSILYALRTIRRDRKRIRGAGELHLYPDGSIQVYWPLWDTYVPGVCKGPLPTKPSVLFDLVEGKAHIRA